MGFHREGARGLCQAPSEVSFDVQPNNSETAANLDALPPHAPFIEPWMRLGEATMLVVARLRKLRGEP